MSAVNMDHIRNIVDQLVIIDYSRGLSDETFKHTADKHINHLLGINLAKNAYNHAEGDGILSVSIAEFKPERGLRQYASGPIDPLNHNTDPVDVDTLYNIGSISKFIIMVMCMRLCQQNRLSLHDNIEMLLSNTDIPHASSITIKDLLGHYSGLKDQCFKLLDKSEASSMLLNGGSGSIVTTQPGHEFYYANVNFVILAKIICSIMQRNLQQCLEMLICQPLELKFIYTLDTISSSYRHAIGYKADPISHQLIDSSKNYIFGASSFLSTPGEMVKLMYAFFHHDDFISPSTRQLILNSPHDVTFEVVTKTDVYKWPATIGMGIEKRKLTVPSNDFVVTLYCHGGWQDSHAAFLAYSPETYSAYCCTVTKTQGLERIKKAKHPS